MVESAGNDIFWWNLMESLKIEWMVESGGI